MFIKVTHDSLKDADGHPATADVPDEALEHYKTLGWKADKAALKVAADEAKELEAEHKAAAKAEAAARA